MTKEITKSVILQEMQDKLALREFEPDKFLFSETVVPTYDIEQHLEEHWQKYITESITAIGSQFFISIPPTEKWTMSRYDVVFMTGTYTVAGVYFTRPPAHRAPSDAYMYLDLTAAQSVSYHVEMSQPVILEPNSSIFINIDGYTVTGNLRLYIDYMKEEIR